MHASGISKRGSPHGSEILASPDAILTALAGVEARLLERIDERFEEHFGKLQAEMVSAFTTILLRLEHFGAPLSDR